jgi:hypothetical protein
MKKIYQINKNTKKIKKDIKNISGIKFNTYFIGQIFKKQNIC